MAHCDEQMSDQEPMTIPMSGVAATWMFTRTNAIGGSSLGCTAGLTEALCVSKNPTGSTAYGQPYLFALDPATGRQLWNSGAYLNGTVSQGAPLIDAGGNSYVSDNNYLASFDANGNSRWRVPNPARTPMISLNVTADGHLVGQGTKGPLLAVSPSNGAITGQILLTDTVDGQTGAFITLNTVSVAGNRVYTVTEFCPGAACSNPLATFSQGRLYAIDIVNGVPRVAWHWDFAGPSGGSPLTIISSMGVPTIYFDGAGQNVGDPHHPWLFAIQDQGSAPLLLWSVDFTASYGVPYVTGIQVSPLHDPRGGVWEWVTGAPSLFRFSQTTGALSQVINVNSALRLSGYTPTGVMSTATNGGHPVMILPVGGPQSTARAYLVTLDLVTGTVVWELNLGAGPNQCFKGQAPLVQTPNGIMAVLSRSDSLVYGIQLE